MKPDFKIDLVKLNMIRASHDLKTAIAIEHGSVRLMNTNAAHGTAHYLSVFALGETQIGVRSKLPY